MTPAGGDDLPVPMAGGAAPTHMTVGDIVSLFLALRGDIQNVEKSIRASLREEREATAELFRSHDRAHAERDAEIDEQLTRLEKLVRGHIEESDRRRKQEEINEAVYDGRVRPLLRVVAFLKSEWKWIAVVFLWLFQFVDDVLIQMHTLGILS